MPALKSSVSPDNSSLPTARWSKQNRKTSVITARKLGGVIWSFNLPAFVSRAGFKVCPFAGTCQKLCFARTGYYRRRHVQDMYEGNLAALLEGFDLGGQDGLLLVLRGLMDEVREKNRRARKRFVRYIRIHDSGDFFSVEYLRAWIAVAAENPDITFYAYTKAVAWVRLHSKEVPSNLLITFSEGGTQDRMIGSRSRARIIVGDVASPEWALASKDDGDVAVVEAKQLIAIPFHSDHRINSQQEAMILASADRNDRQMLLDAAAAKESPRPVVHRPGHPEQATTLLYGLDVLEGLNRLKDQSIDCVVTSPPYWRARTYAVPDRTTEDGWKGQLGHEPDPDLFVEHLVQVFRELKRVLTPDGTVWVNLADGYVGGRGPRSRLAAGDGGLPVRGRPGCRTLIPERFKLAMVRDGWVCRSEITWQKVNPLTNPRVTRRPHSSPEPLMLFSLKSQHYYDQAALAEVAGTDGDTDVWTFPTARREATRGHVAPFPLELPRRCIAAGCRPGGVVLDPFGGSGTTAVAATELGRTFTLIDADATLETVVRDRLAETQPDPQASMLEGFSEGVSVQGQVQYTSGTLGSWIGPGPENRKRPVFLALMTPCQVTNLVHSYTEADLIEGVLSVEASPDLRPRLHDPARPGCRVAAQRVAAGGWGPGLGGRGVRGRWDQWRCRGPPSPGPTHGRGSPRQGRRGHGLEVRQVRPLDHPPARCLAGVPQSRDRLRERAGVRGHDHAHREDGLHPARRHRRVRGRADPRAGPGRNRAGEGEGREARSSSCRVRSPARQGSPRQGP